MDCIAAEWVVRFRDGYRGDADDRADVQAVCERFGLAVPPQYRCGRCCDTGSYDSRIPRLLPRPG